jgi:hypothetical protein
VDEWSNKIEDGLLSVVITALVKLIDWPHLVLVKNTLEGFQVVLSFGSFSERLNDKEVILADLHQLEFH